MTKFARTLLMCSVLACAMPLTPVYANPAPIDVNKMEQFAVDQLNDMVKEALLESEARFAKFGTVRPFGVVALTSGKTKVVRIDQADDVPAVVAVEVVRRSFQALAKQGRIGASVVVYQAETEETKDKDTRLLTLEVEHVFGFSQAKVIPFVLKDGKPVFGKSVDGSLTPFVFAREDVQEEKKQ